MSTQPVAQSSSHARSGDWRRRLVRYHLPLVLASAVATFLWMSLPVFRQSPTTAADHQMPMPAQAAQAAHHQMPMMGQSPDHQMRMPAQAAQAADHQMPARAAGSPMPPHGAQAAGASTTPMDQDGIASLVQNRGFMSRFTTATGYVALVLLALTLLIGPANLLLRKRNPVSNYLCRDVGTWTAILSVVHVIAGFQVHGPPVALGERMLRYFFAPDGSLRLIDAVDAGLAEYHPLHAARADLLRRAGRRADAAAAYDRAIALRANAVERRYLQRRLAEVRGTTKGSSRRTVP
jgi:hypothetical protein